MPEEERMIPIDLSGRTALVTGGAAGIGKACVAILARAGARVAVADIDLEGAEKTASVWEGCSAYRCDVADQNSVVGAATAVGSELGAVDILVHCAGVIVHRRGIRAVEPAEWDSVMAVNLRGAYLLSRELVEGMKERGFGKIVHVSSLAARVGAIETGIHYSASKAGLVGLVRTLAKEGAPYGVTVNAVAPGIIATEPVMKKIADHVEDYIRAIPMGRLGEPEDVASVVLFLCSPLSDYITGATLDINGGQYMG
jgi:NAD(P)-dependent dehydrogenase (short-subunit alcohol dehydrogenase family)